MDYKSLKAKLLTKKFKKIIAADIGAVTIRIAAVNCAKAAHVTERLVVKDLPPQLQADGYLFNAQALASFLKKVLRSEKITGDALVFTVGGDKTALINLQLPYLPKQELHEASRWEIVHETGSSADSFCHTAFYHTHNAGVLNDVTAIVMPDTAAKALTQTAELLEMPLAGIFLRSTAVEQTLAKTYKDFILCCRTDDNGLAITAFCNDLPVLQKNINAADIDNLLFEIENLTAMLPYAEIKAIVLNGFDNAAAADLQNKTTLPVTANKIGSSIGFAETLPPESLQQLDRFAPAVGAALALTANSSFNLVSMPKAGLNFPRWKFYRAAAACCAVCILAVWGWHLAELFILQQHLKDVDRQISDISTWQERYEDAAAVNAQLNRRLKLAENIKAQNIDWNSALADISNAVPIGCWLERIEQGSAAKELTITGSAANIDKAVEFSENLLKQQANAKAEITELKNEQTNGKNLAAFNLILERK